MVAQRSIRRRIAAFFPFMRRALARIEDLESKNREMESLIAIHSQEKIALMESIYATQADHVLNNSKENLPLPPAHLRFGVVGTTDASHFTKMGHLMVSITTEVLRSEGILIGDMSRILDFGCGVGKILRYLPQLDSLKLYGTDNDSQAIAWCKANLPFVRFNQNELSPPLPYPSEFFDMTLAFSVFTHLPEFLQNLWLKELHRILKPTGHLILTLNSEAFLEFQLQHISPLELNSFRNGQLIVKNSLRVGQMPCMAFHPADYVMKWMSPYFEMIHVIPCLDEDCKQSYYLFRKR